MRSIVVGLPTQTSTSFASALSLTRTCFQFFDEVKIEDPRVHELCNKAGQPSPFQILCECLRRNFGMGDTSCQTHMNPLKHQRSEFTMSVGKHTATVSSEGGKEGGELPGGGGGMGDTSCQTHMNPLKHQWSEFATSVGHTATVSTEGDGEGDGGR